VIVEIQCLAFPPGVEGDTYRHIEAAIRVIERSGLAYEVGALGTTLQGPADDVWRVAREAHEAVLAAGANGLVTVLKVEQARDPEAQPTIESLTGKWRAGA